MSSDTTTSELSFRAQYARRLTREKIYQELSTPGHGFGRGPGDPIPGGPHDLPHDLPEHRGGYHGSPPDLKSFKFCIVGAGVAGLYLAMILSKAGIPYDLLEASDRVGGRMYTKDFTETPHDYYDVGAMRYPKIPLMKR